ncbi:MAG: hypothetical protein Q9221_005950 [Calogaya cf. arnoldii]
MMYAFWSAIVSGLCLSARITYAQNDASVRVPAIRRPFNQSIQYELGGQLSRTAEIYLPGSASYTDTTTRWSALVEADFRAVVVPTYDRDVAATVFNSPQCKIEHDADVRKQIKYANKNNLPFFAVNRGHGASIELNKLRRGISIYIHKRDSITIASDKQSAVLGGGVYADPLIQTLAAQGKVAATTGITCVGMVGAGLGGGMGVNQGLYGLVSDNFLEMTIVTANGSIVTANDRQNADLFWAMRGAGYNFGIVTRFKYKIYDIIPTWYAASYQYTHDKLDVVFTALNKLIENGTQPREFTAYTVLANNPGISDKPVIIVNLWYAGPLSSALPYIQPFLNLHPTLISNQTVPWANFANVAGIGLESPPCQSRAGGSTFPVGLQKYNITANRQVYDLYSDLITKYPQFKSSFIQFESYPMQGVQKIDGASTAYAHRDDNLLVAFQAKYPANDPSFTSLAPIYGHQFQTLFHAGDSPGRPLNTYANYAYGDETTEQLYGYEEWRLRKLRALKKEWDPYGRFDYYHHITQEDRKGDETEGVVRV